MAVYTAAVFNRLAVLYMLVVFYILVVCSASYMIRVEVFWEC